MSGQTERVCFELRVRPELIDEYVARHEPVRADMLAEIAASGRRNYSLFLGEEGRLIGYYETDDDAAIDVSWLAARAHYSPGHLIRLHRAVFGETPSDYFTRLRHARAWELVRETDMPVATITHRLGFESQSAFCRAFKHAFGMTATQARRGETDACAA